jgi:hypothetical protein
MTGLNGNMKNALMFIRNKTDLRKRTRIHTVNDELKNICRIEHACQRCFVNFITNRISFLIAYPFLPEKPSLKCDIMNMGVLRKIDRVELRFL